MGKSREVARLPNAPAFSAFRSGSNQSVTSGTWTKVQCQTEEFDTASAYDNATNFRFTPQVAGYYQVNAQLTPTGTSLTRILCAIYKNGAIFKTGGDLVVDARLVLSTLIYLNGSTDYIELFGLVSATNPGFAVGSPAGLDTYFQACLVRAA